MRRAHPRFDARRNAWVTNAGGRLKVLASGPKTTKTESEAWDAFYQHMAKLGQPVEGWRGSTITLGQLADEYGEWMNREVEAKRLAPATRAYYIRGVQKFLDTVGGRRPASAILPIELERFKTGWHSVQTVQRLYNWGVRMGLLERNQLKEIARPQQGRRKRILTPAETAKLLRTADKHFRRFLLAQRQTVARPQEIRALRWRHLVPGPFPAFMLDEFKGKQLRKDQDGLRVIVVDRRLARLLTRLARRHRTQPDDFVFLNRVGKPWTANAIRCRMRRLRVKAGLKPDANGERVVAYSLRHTSATRLTVGGIHDRTLADLMGHSSTQTTARYQHLQLEHLHAAMDRANKRAQ